jgi:hypothetical protein
LSARGLSAADVNIDGQTDLIAANYWLKLYEQTKFKPTQIDEPDGIIATGRFNEGTYPQIVSTGRGRLAWFECRIEPDKSSSWGSHDLLSERIGTLIVADLNRDDRDDILASTSGNLVDPAEGPAGNARSSTWILYGDSKGNFKTTLLPITNIWQTVSVVDLNRDGGLDLIGFTAEASPHLEIWFNETTPQTRPTAPVQRP